jgi:diaminohydroxyphosphoribosylaminopyrimidine deaminase/5-amino-6-(5-phosphoribosylamino)uracil reductase
VQPPWPHAALRRSLIAAGVPRVVAAMTDPNPLVAGKGLALLQAAGIDTAVGLLENEARELNIGFVSRMTAAGPGCA